MKGRIVLFALLLLALTQAACAQVRLFPRKGRQEVLDTAKVAVPDSTLFHILGNFFCSIFQCLSGIPLHLRLHLEIH